MAHPREFTLAHVAYVQVRLLALSDFDMTSRLPNGSLFSFGKSGGKGGGRGSGAEFSAERPQVAQTVCRRQAVPEPPPPYR